MSDMAHLVVDHLHVGPPGAAALVKGVSFSVARGEIVGIVGESGSGKSLTALAIGDLLPPGIAVAGGDIRLDGQALAGLDAGARRALGGRAIGFVFQDPLSSLNPVRRIGQPLIDSAMRHRGLGHAAARSLAIERLAAMRLPEPERIVDAYPHQLSGGQRQRVVIALALLNDPALLIADEPTTALDATVQRVILALLKREAAGRATILITHDLAVAASLCHRIVVMRSGAVVETGATADVLERPQADYTRALLAARSGIGKGAGR